MSFSEHELAAAKHATERHGIPRGREWWARKAQYLARAVLREAAGPSGELAAWLATKKCRDEVGAKLEAAGRRLPRSGVDVPMPPVHPPRPLSEGAEGRCLREMSLHEYVGALLPAQRARKEWAELLNVIAAKDDRTLEGLVRKVMNLRARAVGRARPLAHDADGPTQEEVERLVGAARAACDRWWEHGLQDGEGQRLMRTLGDICAGIGARPSATRADGHLPSCGTTAGEECDCQAQLPSAHKVEPAGLEVRRSLLRRLEAVEAERDELDRKGREICSAYGLALIDLHDERAAREKAEAELRRVTEGRWDELGPDENGVSHYEVPVPLVERARAFLRGEESSNAG